MRKIIVELNTSSCLKHVVSRGLILKKSVHGTSSVSCQELGIVSYQNFSMSLYITFKKKTSPCGSHVGHLGHIWIALWVNGPTDLPTFSPDCTTNPLIV